MRIGTLIRDLKNEFRDAVIYCGGSPAEPEEHIALSETDNVVIVNPRRLRAVCEFLRLHKGFNYLITLTAVDFPERETIEMLYFIYSMNGRVRLELKCLLPRDRPGIASLCSVWKAAELPEREVFDLFGVSFKNHPDLRRIFLEDDFEGHPLRKDWNADFFLRKPEVKFR